MHAAADEQDRQAGRVQGKTNHSREFFRQKLCNYAKMAALGLKFVQHCGCRSRQRAQRSTAFGRIMALWHPGPQPMLLVISSINQLSWHNWLCVNILYMRREIIRFSYNASTAGGATGHAMQGQIPCAKRHCSQGDCAKGSHRRHGILRFSIYIGSFFYILYSQ